MQFFLRIFFTLLIIVGCNAKSNNDFWKTFEEVDKAVKESPKKSMVFIYDPDCEDCTVVRKESIETENNLQFIKEHFYPIEISIHENRSIQFNNKEWKKKYDVVGRPYHELAQVLNGEENITAPCITFLDESLNMIVPIKKPVKAAELELLLVYVANDHFKKKTIEEFAIEYEYGSYVGEM